jgi:hypothetical protein
MDRRTPRPQQKGEIVFENPKRAVLPLKPKRAAVLGNEGAAERLAFRCCCHTRLAPGSYLHGTNMQPQRALGSPVHTWATGHPCTLACGGPAQPVNFQQFF